MIVAWPSLQLHFYFRNSVLEMGCQWSEYTIVPNAEKALLFELDGYSLAGLPAGFPQQFSDIGILIFQGDIECRFP